MPHLSNILCWEEILHHKDQDLLVVWSQILSLEVEVPSFLNPALIHLRNQSCFPLVSILNHCLSVRPFHPLPFIWLFLETVHPTVRDEPRVGVVSLPQCAS